jgi:hypothetical protein
MIKGNSVVTQVTADAAREILAEWHTARAMSSLGDLSGYLLSGLCG